MIFGKSPHVLFTIDLAGNIELTPGTTLDEASRAFWDSLRNPLRDEVERLRTENTQLRAELEQRRTA